MLSFDSWIRFTLTELFALVLMAALCRKAVLKHKGNTWLKILLAMFAMYMAGLFYGMLHPIYFFRRFSFSTQRLNLAPLRALREWLANPLNFFGNVILFLPMGFFEVLLHPAYSRRRQLLQAALVAAGISLFIEFAQLFNYRVSDIDDLILNTTGGILGALLCMLLQKTGFDRTRIGRVLLPRIPREWRGHLRVTHFCVILVAVMEIVLFTANYLVTVPKPKIRANEAVQTATNVPEEPAATPEPTLVPEPREETTAAPTAAPKVYPVQELELEAGNVLLVKLSPDGEEAQTIFAADCEDLIYPASTLKMLTALTILDIASPEEKVRLGMEVYIPPMDAARAGLEYGMTLTVHDLLEGLLLPSGADAAYALGVYCGRKLLNNEKASSDQAVRAFVEAMNRKAEAVGAVNTTVRNVVGLDDREQKTTVNDILILARDFLRNPVLAEICGIPRDRITSENGKTVSLKNTNKMLLEDSRFFNENVTGVKTGTTSRAGNCLVSVFTIGDERFIAIVMNSSYDGKFTDTQKLYDLCAQAK